MGQYHIVANLTKREFIDPNKIGCGVKFLEQCGEFIGTPQLLFILLCKSLGRGNGDLHEVSFAGRWAGDEIAVVGDYLDLAELPQLAAKFPPDTRPEDVTPYGIIKYDTPSLGFKDITPRLADAFSGVDWS
jgi:hypothetical protein